MFKLDTHVHTAETSACGRIYAKDAVRLYKEAGYHGIVITDHYYKDYFEAVNATSWDDKIESFLQGYKNAVDEGSKEGLTILLGIELRFIENPSDYLVYGITEEFLKEYPKLYDLGVCKFRQLIEKEDILLFQAHPYRNGMVVAPPGCLHGVEVFNGNARHESRNEKAYRLAKEQGLMMSSGSDFHQIEDLNRGGMIIKNEIKTSSELVKAFRNNEAMELKGEIAYGKTKK